MSGQTNLKDSENRYFIAWTIV